MQIEYWNIVSECTGIVMGCVRTDELGCLDNVWMGCASLRDNGEEINSASIRNLSVGEYIDIYGAELTPRYDRVY